MHFQIRSYKSHMFEIDLIRDEGARSVGFATGYVLRNFVCVIDMQVNENERRKGYGTLLLELLKYEFDKNVWPVAPLNSAKEFWEHWCEYQGGGSIEQSVLLQAIAFEPLQSKGAVIKNHEETIEEYLKKKHEERISK